MTGWIDRAPTWARDLGLMLVASLLSWAGSDLVPVLRDKGGAAALAAPALVLVINALSTATRAYGRGAPPPYLDPAKSAPRGTE